MCSTFRSFHRMNPIPYTSLSIRPHRARCPIPRCLGPSFARWQWTSRRAAPWWQTPGLLDIGAETRSGAVGGSLLVPQAETPCSGRNKSNGSSMFQHVPMFQNPFCTAPHHTHTYTLKLKSKMPGKTSTKLAVTERSKDRVCRTSRLSTPACVLVGFLWFFHLAKPSPRVDQSTDCSSLRGDNPFHL